MRSCQFAFLRRGLLATRGPLPKGSKGVHDGVAAGPIRLAHVVRDLACAGAPVQVAK